MREKLIILFVCLSFYVFGLGIAWVPEKEKPVKTPIVCNEEIEAMKTMCEFKEGKACDTIQLIYLNCLVRENKIKLNKDKK